MIVTVVKREGGREKRKRRLSCRGKRVSTRFDFEKKKKNEKSLTIATARGLAARIARLSRWTRAQRPNETSIAGLFCGSSAERRLETSSATCASNGVNWTGIGFLKKKAKYRISGRFSIQKGAALLANCTRERRFYVEMVRGAEALGLREQERERERESVFLRSQQLLVIFPCELTLTSTSKRMLTLLSPFCFRDRLAHLAPPFSWSVFLPF